MVWWLLLSIGVNVVCVWINFRSIRAYYDAHDLLMNLCLHAWRMRDRGELWPLYQRTLGRAWTDRTR